MGFSFSKQYVRPRQWVCVLATFICRCLCTFYNSSGSWLFVFCVAVVESFISDLTLGFSFNLERVGSLTMILLRFFAYCRPKVGCRTLIFATCFVLSLRFLTLVWCTHVVLSFLPSLDPRTPAAKYTVRLGLDFTRRRKILSACKRDTVGCCLVALY